VQKQPKLAHENSHSLVHVTVNYRLLLAASVFSVLFKVLWVIDHNPVVLACVGAGVRKAASVTCNFYQGIRGHMMDDMDVVVARPLGSLPPREEGGAGSGKEGVSDSGSTVASSDTNDGGNMQRNTKTENKDKLPQISSPGGEGGEKSERKSRKKKERRKKDRKSSEKKSKTEVSMQLHLTYYCSDTRVILAIASSTSTHSPELLCPLYISILPLVSFFVCNSTLFILLDSSCVICHSHSRHIACTHLLLFSAL
jgi:hypothetical protein